MSLQRSNLIRTKDAGEQPYSYRPVDTTTTDYPWNHGITGYFLPAPTHVPHPRVVSVVKRSASVGEELRYSLQNLWRTRSLPRLQPGLPRYDDMTTGARRLGMEGARGHGRSLCHSGKIVYWMYQRYSTIGIQKW